MKKIRVINYKQLPAKLPLSQTFLALLAIDVWKAPASITILLTVVLTLWWVSALIRIASQEEIEIEELK